MAINPVDYSAIDPRAQLLDLDRLDYEESLYAFYREAWKYIDPAPWTDGWCMQAIAEHLEAVCDGTIKRLLINISPRCSKSNLVSVAFPAWVWAQPIRGPISGPAVPFLHASYANQLSLRDSVKCRRLIESPWYQERWGHRYALTSDQNTKSRFTNNQGGERLITSIDGTNTGEGGMCFVAGTPVLTQSGQRPIESLRVGDVVIAVDHSTDTEVETTIVATYKKSASRLVVFESTEDNQFCCTPEHLIFTKNRGYVECRDLLPGDELRWCADHDKCFVASVDHFNLQTDVYDIQVGKHNNFFADGILVHNCIIIDDPNSVDDVDSEATIQTAIDWWEGTMPTRLNDQNNGAYIIIQQRTFENDLTGHILETEADDWVHLMIPMRYEPDRTYTTPIGWSDPRTVEGELMWPARFGEAATSRLEKRLGSWRTAGQLQQRPEPAGGGIIRRAWWGLWDSDVFPKDMDFTLACLDTAFTESQLNDPSGMIVWGVFSNDTTGLSTRVTNSDPRDEPIQLQRLDAYGSPKIILMSAWDAHLTLHELVKRVEATCRQFRVDLLLIENKANGISVAQEIKRLFNNEKFGVQLFDPKSQDKMARLISIQHLFEEGLIFAPSEKFKWVERVISQVGQFPKGAHDEFVDLTSMGLRYLRGNGLIARAPEREIELAEQKRYRSPSESQPLYPA